MSEPDWTEIEAVRAWLGERYHVANRETGSPFFQYLKDELAKGNKFGVVRPVSLEMSFSDGFGIRIRVRMDRLDFTTQWIH